VIVRGSRWVPAIVAASVLALGLVGCGGSSSTPHTATTTPSATTNIPASTIPDYQPTTVVSRSSHSTVLTSPDSVSKVGAFYSDVLKKDGWEVRSSSVSAYHASFSAHRNNEGVSISVYPRGSGSGISISTYRQ
jgi:hypothetical protein